MINKHKEGILENECLGRVIDEMCKSSKWPTDEWDRLSDVLINLINEFGYFNIKLRVDAPALPDGVTYRARVNLLLNIFKIISKENSAGNVNKS